MAPEMLANLAPEGLASRQKVSRPAYTEWIGWLDGCVMLGSQKKLRCSLCNQRVLTKAIHLRALNNPQSQKKTVAEVA